MKYYELLRIPGESVGENELVALTSKLVSTEDDYGTEN